MLLDKLLIQREAQSRARRWADHALLIKFETALKHTLSAFTLGDDMLHDEPIGDGGHEVHMQER